MDYKLRVNKKSRDWPKRLLRKSAAHTMQREDKNGPKKITGERRPRRAPQRGTHSRLRFTCCQCGDDLEYVPKDLVRHFEDKHKGSVPVFPCHTCTFSTHQFSYLQVHLLSHQHTFSSCTVCHDNVQRTWPEFSAHLAASHRQNGKFTCETCQTFSTGDARVFLEHRYAHQVGQDGAAGDAFLQHGDQASHKEQDDPHRRKKKEGHSRAMKPTEPPTPKTKARLTRSAVREMCWLTEDCLALPGKDFLDKYCHLSDPHTTMQETQQFLMKSVAGENGDRRWTKALKSVLSNVPQEMSLHSKSDNGIMSTTSDLTVLTVKNKITVDQRAAKYAKRFKVVSEKESDEAHDGTPETKPDVTTPPQSEPSECTQTQEDRENQEVETEEQKMRDGKKEEEPVSEDAVKTISNKSAARKCVHKPKRRNNRWRPKRRRKKESAALKIVLKKNPVKQWVSQRSLNPLDAGTTDPGLQRTSPLQEVHPKTRIKTPKTDLPAVLSASQPEEEPSPARVGKPTRSRDVSIVLQHHVMSGHAEVDRSRTAAGRRPESVRTWSGDAPAADGVTSPEDQPASTAQGQIHSEDVSALASEHAAEGKRDEWEQSSPARHAARLSSPDSPPLWRRAPKSRERTLKLVAINPSQLVKRPAGDQPVVVLNHPDTEIPEVSRIMAVVRRYRGEVQKVVLSRSTVSALSGVGGACSHPAGLAKSSVQERFLLKMKFRRLSRKKYEVVDAAAPCGDGVSKLSCWFCGRVFACQDTWTAHRQRHLMEWKQPNCEDC